MNNNCPHGISKFYPCTDCSDAMAAPKPAASSVPDAVAKAGSAQQQCLRDVMKQLVLMMDDCEEHADGRITIDCDHGAEHFLRRIYDLLNALEIYTPDDVDEAFSTYDANKEKGS